jgi:phage replication O-like protein O
MEDKDLQLENGHFTRIANKILDILASVNLTGSELRVVLFIIRKTYGYNKKEDLISLSQIKEGTEISKRNIIYILQNLEAKKILMVTREKLKTNNIRFNKYYDTWIVQNSAPQVKNNREIAKIASAKLRNDVKDNKIASAKLGKTVVQNSVKKVKSFAHTKERKTITKDNSKKETFLQGKQWNELIDSFKDINPIYEDFYKNTTERKALDTLAKKITFEKLLATIKKLPETNSIPYFPKITSPSVLKRDLGKLIASYNQEKAKSDIKLKAEGNKRQSFAGIAQEIKL